MIRNIAAQILLICIGTGNQSEHLTCLEYGRITNSLSSLGIEVNTTQLDKLVDEAKDSELVSSTLKQFIGLKNRATFIIERYTEICESCPVECKIIENTTYCWKKLKSTLMEQIR